MTIEERTEMLLRKTLDLGEDVDLRSVAYHLHPNWDSVGHVALIVAIEDEFNVELDTGQVLEIQNLDSAVKLLQALGVDS